MDLLFKYTQEKKERGNNTSNCLLELYYDNCNVTYIGYFDLDYKRYGKRKHIKFEHGLHINIKTGNIKITYKIINDGLTEDKFFRNVIKSKENDFKLLEELTHQGFMNGEKKHDYWGVKYKKAIEKIFSEIHLILYPQLKNSFLINKNYLHDKLLSVSLYELVVDFHLDKKNIKGHDSVYWHIKYEYPTKKWLKINDNKFLPSVLDRYGLKSKYLIGELNKKSSNMVFIKSINYFKHLFGENYIDYLKKFSWTDHCFYHIPNNKLHQLKNETEKKHVIDTLNKWNNYDIPEPFVFMVNKLLTIRDKLEQHGYTLKYDSKNYREFENLLEVWCGLKKHITRGYKLKYIIQDQFKEYIESSIFVKDGFFKPKLILSEEDFRIEGYKMKNCMAKQFSHGAIYLFVALQHKRTRINLQYRKGSLNQSLGKANSPTPPVFNDAIDVLNKRFSKYPLIEWTKIKYDFICNDK